ncbi:MAG: sugar phosphate isomerase/epimerase [Bryobacteraceae bacterium]|nr:sugar phosphate isomerase/epimerase [Bryobacteraceae bacterium]
MHFLPRRNFLSILAAPILVRAQTRVRRLMKIHFTPGSIGVKATQREAIDLAYRHGFEAVEPNASYLAELSDSQMSELLGELKSKNLTFGNAGLPVEFRRSEQQFAESMAALPKLLRGLQRAGVTRVSTWISPAHDTLTYLQNLRQHRERLRQCAKILGDYGMRLGLEYVGPKTSWTARRYPFIHSMAEMKDLIAEIGLPNVGFVLDSWHWYTAGETEADLMTLRNQDIVSVDLNDAPAGVAVDQQIDSKRELPMATGVINLDTFLNALNKLGYDGPVRPEPFNEALRKLPPEEAVAVTAAAMKKAFTLIR